MARRVVGMIWPPPREMESGARERSVSLKRVLRIAVGRLVLSYSKMNCETG